MAKKRTSLDAILPTSAERLNAASKAIVHQEHNAEPAKADGRRPHVKQQALYLKHSVHRQLRVLAFEEEKKMHDLCLEALDLLFANRGLPSIAELQNE